MAGAHRIPFWGAPRRPCLARPEVECYAEPRDPLQGPVNMPDPPIDIGKWFIDQPDPPEHTYELALVLGGTVSAGCYTAGALDFLIEALDTWNAAKEKNDPQAPTHKVALRVIAGTSGGGVNAAIMARALAFKFPPVTRGTSPSLPQTGNPFYDTWVNKIRLLDFLDNADLQAGKIHSALNGAPLEGAARDIVSFTGPFAHRPYIGVPDRDYRTAFQESSGEWFVDHADYARFAFAYPGAPAPALRPDEFAIGFGPTDQASRRLANEIDWDSFSHFALATAAFPVGFPPRQLARPTEHYRYRVVAPPPDESGNNKVQAIEPDWDMLFGPGNPRPADYQFLAVDGGATDNEPIGLARTALCGVVKRNPRDPLKANRGVLLVDPFAGEPGLSAPAPDDLLAVTGGVLNSLIQQTRYDTSDLLLALDPDVFSRFMVSARRDGLSGSKAIATGGLGAFIGFASPAFMRHDYLLGRANCQALLARSFLLSPDNPVVRGCWSPDALKLNGVQRNGQQFVRIIPLLDDVAVPENLDPWPKGALDPAIFKSAIEQRWKALITAELRGLSWGKLLGWFGGLFSEGQVADFVIKKMNDALREWDLAR
jgi:Patatin-like phospholipase